MSEAVETTAPVEPPRPRRRWSRVLSALLVLRLEAREIAPLSAGLVLLSWLHRPAIEMPLAAFDQMARRRQALLRRLDTVYPF